jgi:hypothetical protein
MAMDEIPILQSDMNDNSNSLNNLNHVRSVLCLMHTKNSIELRNSYFSDIYS